MPRLPETYVSFQAWLKRDGSKHICWDVYDKDERVYRFSTIFMKLLRRYIQKLLYAHRRGKVHGWSLMKNLMFRKGECMSICFRKKPVSVAEDDDLQERKKRDFLALVELIENVRDHHHLPEFPKEISKFLALLRDPIGNVHLIQSHYALCNFRKRIRMVFSIQRQIENPLNENFHARASFLFDRKLLTSHTRKGHFRDVFKGDVECERMFDRSYDEMNLNEDSNKDGSSGEKMHYGNIFSDLIRFIRNFVEHREKNKKGDKYLEWKIHCHFPFYTWLLCEKLAEVGLYPRLP